METVTTGKNGRVYVNLDAGSYYAVEVEGVKGFKVNAAPLYFEVKDGRTTTLTAQNIPYSGIEIHKIDSTTGAGIYNAKFLLYDAEKHPIGEYVSDQNGYVYIDGLTRDGRYFLRELECEGYNVDTQMKTVTVKAGEVVTDICFDFGKVPVGFQSVTAPTLSVQVSGIAANGYTMVNRADVGGKYGGTWQTANASWATAIIRLGKTPTLPKTGVLSVDGAAKREGGSLWSRPREDSEESRRKLLIQCHRHW